MHVQVRGTQLWFDVDGVSLVPDGAAMLQRPTVLVLHGGPGAFDHSLYKRALWRLTEVAQVVYMDLRGHGRSGRHAGSGWSLDLWADDVAAFCDALGIDRPVVWGHSFGSFVAARYAARHRAQPAGLVLQNSLARWNLDSVAEGFSEPAGAEVGDLARRFFGGDASVAQEYVARCLPVYGPWVPTEEDMARTIVNPELIAQAPELLRSVDLTEALGRIACPTLVGAGDQDPLTRASDARQVADHLPADLARLEVFEGAGHFTWQDVPDAYWPIISDFVVEVGS